MSIRWSRRFYPYCYMAESVVIVANGKEYRGTNLRLSSVTRSVLIELNPRTDIAIPSATIESIKVQKHGRWFSLPKPSEVPPFRGCFRN
jgi:hypothetical protein